ncbi:conjugal transfer protein TraG N-terminal domain-containing protein, partial [Sulfurimonas sp.]
MKTANKILILFVLMLLTAMDASAAEITFVNAFPIYTYGDVSYMATVYEFVKSVATDASVQTILGLGFTVAAFIAGWRARLGGVGDIIKSAAAPITLYALFVVPTVNVHITDLRVDKGLIDYPVPDGGYKKVENVPYAIAFLPSSASLIVSLFIDLIDDNWDSVNIGNRFSTIGFQGTANISKQAIIIANMRDIDHAKNGYVYDMNQYIKHCLVEQGLKSPLNYHKLTHPSKPFPDMFNPADYNGSLETKTVTFDNEVDANGSSVVNITCGDAYTKYVSSRTSDIETDMSKLLKDRYNIDPESATFNEAWREHIGDNVNTVGTITKAMSTTAATRALEKALDTEGIGVNGVSMATELSIDSTLANLRTEGLAKWDWITRAIPDAISIVLAILIGAFPIMIVVMSFFGKDALMGIANYFMGYMAINFNLVSLALVNNIISYYTAQHAVEAMSSYAGMPFGLSQINEFMMQQADMTGLAGIIGAVSVFAVTPLIFKGETAGFAAAMSAVSGAYRGNVVQSAEKTLTDYDAQRTLDEQATTLDGMTEAEAGAWLAKEGFTKPNNMSAVAAYNDMMKNYGSIGSADAASILHSGNAGKFNTANYIAGSEAQSLQSMGKTAGLGASMNSGVVSEAEIENVSIQDGEAMGSMLHNTSVDRAKEGYDANLVGAGQAHQQVAKDMASQLIGSDKNAIEKLTASAQDGAAQQLAAGAGLLRTGAFNPNGTANMTSQNMQDHIKDVETKAAEKLMSSAGSGSEIDTYKAMAKAYEDGARNADAINKASDKMFSGERDKHGNLLYDRDMAAEGQAANEMAQHAKNMAISKAMSKPKTGEQSGYADFISGQSAMARKSANDAIGIGEDWQKLSEKEQIALMAKDKKNAGVGFRGGIEATNAEISQHKDAIKDMVTSATEKGVGSATHA